MPDPTKWPDIPHPHPGEVGICSTEISDSEKAYVAAISKEASDYVSGIYESTEMSDEDSVVVMSQVYDNAARVIQQRTGLRCVYQMKLSLETLSIEVRCFFFRRLH